MLIHRVLTALVTVPIILAAVWFGPPWITALAGVAAVIGVWESYRLYPRCVAQGSGISVKGLPAPLGAIWSAALVLGGELAATPYDFAKTAVAICVAGFIVGGLWMIAAWRGQRPALAAAWIYLTPMYVGGALACAVALRGIESIPDSHSMVPSQLAGMGIGLWWLLLAILAVYAADTAAYFVGRLIGRRRMAPNISPGKTWEGAAGGLGGAVIVALALGMVSPLSLEVWQAAVTGVILGVVSPAGDLMESKVKRWAGVKDSGSIFPGHGGMLDRLDSLLPSFIVVYVMAVVFTSAN